MPDAPIDGGRGGHLVRRGEGAGREVLRHGHGRVSEGGAGAAGRGLEGHHVAAGPAPHVGNPGPSDLLREPSGPSKDSGLNPEHIRSTRSSPTDEVGLKNETRAIRIPNSRNACRIAVGHGRAKVPLGWPQGQRGLRGLLLVPAHSRR